MPDAPGSDPRRTIGRGNYLLVNSVFFFVVVAGGVLYLLMSVLATAASDVQSPGRLDRLDSHPGVSAACPVSLSGIHSSLASFGDALARDMHMHVAWVLPKLIAYCIPAVSIRPSSMGRCVGSAAGCYAFVIELIPIFAPGDQFKHVIAAPTDPQHIPDVLQAIGLKGLLPLDIHRDSTDRIQALMTTAMARRRCVRSASA